MAVAADYWEELRPGKRQALWTQTVSIHDDNKTEYVVQRVMRHPAKRRRIRTVLQELVHRAALVVHKARQIILDFGQDIGRMTVLNTLRSRLRYPRGTPC